MITKNNMTLNHLNRRHPELTRERLVNPHEATLLQRLVASNAVELRENLQIVPLGNGYDRVVPVDTSLTIARERRR